MTWRAGAFGATNVVLGLVFAPAFLAIVVVCCLLIARGDDVGPAVAGGVLALVACAVMVAVLLGGISNWRPVTPRGAPLSCDSIASTRSQASVERSPAWRAVTELRAAVQEAQHSRMTD